MTEDEAGPYEMHPLMDWEKFEPLSFCRNLEKVMADMPNEDGFAIALDRSSLNELIAVLRRGAMQ